MHPRNRYKVPIDFKELAELYPTIKHCLLPGRHGQASSIDFHDPVTQRALTAALLHRDFGITITLPDDRLCPPVPNRLNYILWLQDIANHSPPPEDGIIRALDIGTGASAIYPLLGCSLEQHWHFTGSDIDEMSFQSARRNVEQNSLQHRITVVLTDPGAPLLAAIPEGEPFFFTMCNPPFYADADEISRSAELKYLPPNATCSGADVEMITSGGETRFVQRMVEESSQQPLRSRWYTSMLGKLSSLSQLVDTLRANKVDNYVITEFAQGQTRRWALGWSFHDDRLPDSIARIDNPNPTIQGLLPSRNTLVQPFKKKIDSTSQHRLLVDCLSAIKDALVVEKSIIPPRFQVSVPGDTWSRKARRSATSTKPTIHNADLSGIVMRCEIGWMEDKEEDVYQLSSQWLKGRDRDIFSSFSSYVFRKVQATFQ